MSFYELPKNERTALVVQLNLSILTALRVADDHVIIKFFEDDDTYIRKSAYLAIGKIYKSEVQLREPIISFLANTFQHEDYKVRQTVINAAGEIGKTDFEPVKKLFDRGLFDAHHSPRNAVIGSIKKMGEVNPEPVLKWAKGYLHHEDKEIRREICHGIELRGRKHPADILPLLKELEFDSTLRVRKTLVHVIGQIAYKKGCLPVVIEHLKNWENLKLVDDAIEEIIDVHHRYKDFAFMTQNEAKIFIDINFKPQH